MSTLSWHPDALDDVARLYDFLAVNSPEIGVPRAEFREWFAPFGRSSYVLRYAILDGGEVLVTRVWHSRERRDVTYGNAV
jgi:plasmid stabilization system protein ParE